MESDLEVRRAQGGRLRHVRERIKDHTLEEAGREIGVSEKRLRDYEKGVASIARASPKNRRSIVKYCYGASDWLLNGTGDAPEASDPRPSVAPGLKDELTALRADLSQLEEQNRALRAELLIRDVAVDQRIGEIWSSIRDLQRRRDDPQSPPQQ